MRRYLATVAVLIVTATPVLAEAPFIPNEKAPDYVVTMVTRTIHGQEAYAQVHTHHGDWTRVEFLRTSRATNYFRYTDSLVVSARRNTAGVFDYLTIRRGTEPYFARDSFRTGETKNILGETCHYWNVLRTPGDHAIVKLSCVTEDGIELAYRWAGGITNVVLSSGEAMQVERRSVPPGDARPPADVLDLKAWNESPDRSDPPAAGAPGDFETVIETQSGPAGRYTRVERRRYPWRFRDERGPDGNHLVSTRNELSGFSMAMTTNAQEGLRTLTINKFAPPPPQFVPEASQSQRPKDLGRSEIILDETCDWFDMMHGAMDAGLHECRTRDGVVLKETQFSRGTRHDLVATRLTRRPVALSEVLPADTLAPRSWGLPQ